MSVINKGVFSQPEVYARAVSNDWPNAQVILTSDVTESSSLYYTNSRVVSAVTPILTTSNVNEGNGLYYTNSRVLSYLAAADLVDVRNFKVEGNLEVVGNLTYLNVTALEIADNMVYLNANNYTTNPDLGLAGNYNDGTYQHAGLFRDATDGIWKFYDSYTPEPDASPYIDTSHATFKLANVQASGFIGPVTGTVSSLANHDTSDLSEGNNLYYTNARVLSAVNPKFTTANVSELTNQYFTNARVLLAVNSKFTTSNVSELTNLYYTNNRVQAYLDAQGYNAGTPGTDLSGNTTTDLAEGNNLYYTNSRVLSHLAVSNVTAQSFNTTGTGAPTLSSPTNVNLSANGSAGGAVIVSNSAFRLKSYTTTDRANLTPSTGDVIYNSTDSSLQVYNGSAWANVGSLSSLIDFDTDDLAEGSNLYYTNTRVQAYLDDQGYAAGGGAGANLAASNTDALSEGVTNLYYTNSRTRSAFTAGQGILIFQGAISVDTGVINVPAEQAFDIATDNSDGYIITDSMEPAFTVSGTNTYRHLLKTLTITNISNNTGYLQANLVYDGTEYEIANVLEIPYGFTTDLRFNAEILMPGTVLKFKSLDNTKAAANNILSSYIAYKTVEDISYGSTITALSSGSYNTIYDASSGEAIVESIKIYNLDGTNQRATIRLKTAEDTLLTYIAANTLLAHNYASEILENPIRLTAGQKLDLQIFGGRATVVTSTRTAEAYEISSNVNTISEGQSVTFTINTVNIGDGATRYFRTLGNVTTGDFVEGNTGSFIIGNDTATVTLTANTDLSPGSEGEEQFKLVIAKTSTTSASVKESNVITIRDTSNSIGVVSATLSSNLIYGTESARVTLNAINGEGNNAGTLYYTLTGNADIYSSTSGSFIVNDNVANLDIIAEGGVPSDEVRTFAVQVRTGSVSGPVQFTSDPVYVKDINTYVSLVDSVDATGGIIQDVEE